LVALVEIEVADQSAHVNDSACCATKSCVLVASLPVIASTSCVRRSYRLTVIFNAGAEATEVTLDVRNLLPDGFLTDVWGGLPERVSKEKLRDFVVPPRSAAIFSAR
jgi:hypothetical protein